MTTIFEKLTNKYDSIETFKETDKGKECLFVIHNYIWKGTITRISRNNGLYVCYKNKDKEGIAVISPIIKAYYMKDLQENKYNLMINHLIQQTILPIDIGLDIVKYLV